MRSTTLTRSQSSFLPATLATATSTSAIAVGGITAGGSGKFGELIDPLRNYQLPTTNYLLYEVAQPVPPDAVGAARGPPHDQRLALDVLQRHRPPVARVVAVVAVVPEDEDVVL